MNRKLENKSSNRISLKLIIFFAVISVAGAFLIMRNSLQHKPERITAHVTFLIGEAEMTRQGISAPLKLDAAVEKGDIIKTGKDSLVVVQVNSLGVLTVLENSILTFNELQSETAKDTSVNLGNGRLFSKILKQQDAKYRVLTSTSTAAVRGTSFLSTAGKNESSHKLLEGKVLVSTVANKKPAVSAEKVLEPGFEAVVKKQTGPVIRKMPEVEKLKTEKLGLHPYTEKTGKIKPEEIIKKIRFEEKEIDQQIKKIEKDLDKLPPLEKLRRSGKPLTMLHLKDGSRLSGWVMSADSSHVRLNTGEKVLNIELHDIRRRVPLK